MTSQSHSTATVSLDRAARFGKQLMNHLSRRDGGEWSAETESGWVSLFEGRSTATVTAQGLDLDITCSPEEQERFENVVGGHLVRFVKDPAVFVTWTRHDVASGATSAGTEQRFEEESA